MNSTKNPKKVLMILSNPSVSKQTGWPIGFWWSELTHPYWEFIQAGWEVTIASPQGGDLMADGYSDPEHESGYSADDFVSLGFKHSVKHKQLLQATLKIEDIDYQKFDAIFLVGGQGPMYTFVGNQALYKLFSQSYEGGKIVAAICHAAAILLDLKLSSGDLLVKGKKWTGFADSEEAYVDQTIGQKVQPFRIETEARKIVGTTFISGPAFQSHTVKDGNLITGQQQHSGAEAARLVIQTK